MQLCPCRSGISYSDCCVPYLTGHKSPPTPEKLMRSRYTAYNQKDLEYILRTMKSPALDKFNIDAVRKKSAEIEWVNLEILQAGVESTGSGFVEFVASYQQNNKIYLLHELSTFHIENGKWYYVSGKYISP